MPRPCVPVPCAPDCQPAFFAGRLNDRSCPRVRQMLQAELDGVGARGLGELVHEGLYRKHVGVGAKRAQRRDAVPAFAE